MKLGGKVLFRVPTTPTTLHPRFCHGLSRFLLKSIVCVNQRKNLGARWRWSCPTSSALFNTNWRNPIRDPDSENPVSTRRWSSQPSAKQVRGWTIYFVLTVKPRSNGFEAGLYTILEWMRQMASGPRLLLAISIFHSPFPLFISTIITKGKWTIIGMNQSV